MGGKKSRKIRRNSKTRGGKRKVNKSLKAWVAFVKKVQKEEKLSYKDAIHRAKQRKDKGEKWMKGGIAPNDDNEVSNNQGSNDQVFNDQGEDPRNVLSDLNWNQIMNNNNSNLDPRNNWYLNYDPDENWDWDYSRGPNPDPPSRWDWNYQQRPTPDPQPRTDNQSNNYNSDSDSLDYDSQGGKSKKKTRTRSRTRTRSKGRN